ncbi:MAG: hypothetical protein ACU0BB_00380 [Paracoccaceae bacterium]
MIRLLGMLAAIALLAACAPPTIDEPLEDLGAFRLGHNIVVAGNVQKVPGSRDASSDTWVAAMTKAVDDRFGQYNGNQLYHFGISIEGYNLAQPGIPIVLAPKSVLAINVTVWDDAAGAKLNDEVKTFTVFETTSAGSLAVGSGYVRSADEQVEGLVINAVAQIEDWVSAQRKSEGWFEPRPGAATDVVIPKPETGGTPVTEAVPEG